jgi:hypothetical protein
MGMFNKLLLAAAVLGMLLPGPGVFLKDSVTALLAASVLFSLLASSQKYSLDWKEMKTGFIYSYLALTLPLVAFSLLLPSGLREGLIMYAIFPPAVGAVTLSSQWKGRPESVLVFQILSYGASIILVPLAAAALIGQGVDAWPIAIQLVIMFIAPFLLSIFLRMKDKKLAGDISGIFLAITFYIVIAKSSGWIIANWHLMLGYSAALGALCFILAYSAWRLSKNPDAAVYALVKNGGAAAAAAMAVLPESATAIISAKVLLDIGMIAAFGKILEKKA